MKMKQMEGKTRCLCMFLLLFALLMFSIALSANGGSVSISPLEVFRIVFLRAGSGTLESNILWKVRLPRLLTAGVLGGALAVSGFLLQTFFRNPIAGPFVLGISSGAKMCVGFILIFVINAVGHVPSYVLVLAALAGSLLTMGIVLLFSGRAKSMSMLLVIGIMIGYICSAVTDFCITFAKDAHVAGLTAWSMGSFSGADWDSLSVICVTVGLSLAGAMLISKPMDAYRLGEGYAKSMGINIRLFRIALILLSSILSACVTAFAGPISFVGIAVPQITKALFKSAKPVIMIPGTFLCGAIFCILCDLIARTAFSPAVLAINTVTALLGAPVVIRLMLKRKSGQ